MALLEAISAKTEAETSDPITLSGPTEFKADDLIEGESVFVHQIRVDGTYEPAMVQGWPVVLTAKEPSVIYEGYSEVKVVKGVTENEVAVGYAS